MPLRRIGRAAVFALMTMACSETSVLEPGDAPGQLTVNASTDWAFVRLGEDAVSVQVSKAAESSAWDIAFFGTSVMLNGGAAGPGGVEGYCVCQNAGATATGILAMTPENQRAAFEAVTAAAIPAVEEAWQVDALSPAISGWYSYDPTTHQVSADPTRVWKVRLAEASNPGYAKLRVIAIEAATRTSAGRVTIEYAVQQSAGAPLGVVRTAVLDVTGGGAVHFDLGRGEVSDGSDWDIALEGFAIRINGGVSGAQSAGAVLASESFEAMTDASDAPAQIYRGDAFGGVFDAHRWYRYNLTGAHDVSPTYDVYLIRRGDSVFKVQLIGYYDAAGESRRITMRYARIAG